MDTNVVPAYLALMPRRRAAVLPRRRSVPLLRHEAALVGHFLSLALIMSRHHETNEH